MLNITTLLFDLGGVLIELGSLTGMMATSPHSNEDIWANWTRSPSVKRYESGRCSSEQFAENMIREFDLSINETEFLEAFIQWPKGTYPGAELMLHRLGDRYHLACLSNTNQAHWESFLCNQAVMTCFRDSFLSHQMGVLKPDEKAYRQVLNTLDVSPENVLFLDDNPGNVAAARKLGINAQCTSSPEGVIDILVKLDLDI